MRAWRACGAWVRRACVERRALMWPPGRLTSPPPAPISPSHVLSTAHSHKVRSAIEASQKRVAAEKKKALDGLIAAGIGAMEDAVKAAVARGDSFLVLDAELGVDSKAVKVCVCDGRGRGASCLTIHTQRPRTQRRRR